MTIDKPHDLAPGDTEYAEHLATYKRFVLAVAIFAGHVLVVLLLLAFFLV